MSGVRKLSPGRWRVSRSDGSSAHVGLSARNAQEIESHIKEAEERIRRAQRRLSDAREILAFENALDAQHATEAEQRRIRGVAQGRATRKRKKDPFGILAP